MGDYREQPDIGRIFRDLTNRVATLERLQLLRPQAELDANRTAPWQTPTLENDFVDLGGGYAPASYYKDTFGRVYLRGVVTNPFGTGGSPVRIFTLAAGYLPVYSHQFSVVTYDGAYHTIRVSVETDGGVLAYDFNPNTPISIDGISFRTL
jgi:hypothetical protein